MSLHDEKTDGVPQHASDFTRFLEIMRDLDGNACTATAHAPGCAGL